MERAIWIDASRMRAHLAAIVTDFAQFWIVGARGQAPAALPRVSFGTSDRSQKRIPENLRLKRVVDARPEDDHQGAVRLEAANTLRILRMHIGRMRLTLPTKSRASCLGQITDPRRVVRTIDHARRTLNGPAS